MKDTDREHLDNVGPWTLRKFEIIAYYAKVYADVLSRAKASFTISYIDGFAGSGWAISKDTADLVRASALRVLEIEPPFAAYHLNELNKKRVDLLREAVGKSATVFITHGDANVILPRDIFPLIRYDKYERAFCLLDPYKLDPLKWETIAAAGANKAIDLLVHFPIMDIQRSVLMKGAKFDPKLVSEKDAQRMTAFWGDESWHEAFYRVEPSLFGDWLTKETSDEIVAAFQHRLKRAAGFTYTPPAIPMRNSVGNIIYYLVFAVHNERAATIVKQVADKFRRLA